MKIGIYGASLDPLTNGHMYIIEQGATLFDKLVIAVAINPNKKYLLDGTARCTLVKKCCQHLSNVEVVWVGSHFLVHLAQDYQAPTQTVFMLRGMRGPTDFEYEQNMMQINRDIAPAILSVPIICPMELAKISSSMVKNLMPFIGWEDVARRYVPAPVLAKLEEIEANKRGQ